MKQPDYTTGLLVVATDKAAGNALAAAVGVSSRDSHTFDDAKAYQKNGVPAWIVGVHVTDVYRAIAECYNGSEPYTLLNNIGMSDADVGAIKAHVKIYPFTTAQFFDGETVAAFIQSLGYVV